MSFRGLIAVLIISLIGSSAYGACQDKRRVKSVTADGEILALNDGSLWRVDPLHQLHVSAWGSESGVRICDSYQVIHHPTEGDYVRAELIAKFPSKVQKNINNERFVIDGRKFRAESACFSMKKGDPVRFLSGGGKGCQRAVILNPRSRQICQAWCGWK